MNKVNISVKSLVFITFSLFYPIVLGGLTEVRASNLEPSKTISIFQSTLLETMKKAENTNIKQRYKFLATNLKKTFHFPIMIQIATGNAWKKATYLEKSKLIESFQRMSIMTLATLFNGYSGEIFKVVKEKKGPQRTTLVYTELIKVDNSKISIIYVTRKFKSGWRIIDVIVDSGISELLVRRSEYKQILKNRRISGLIKLLDNKATELSLK
jgi:hopanoid biosynthesis associated membrane protein HpnM